MTTTATTARDATCIEFEVGDRVGSFSRTDPGTVVEIAQDQVLVLHDGDASPVSYLVAELSRSAVGLFVLNLVPAA